MTMPSRWCRRQLRSTAVRRYRPAADGSIAPARGHSGTQGRQPRQARKSYEAFDAQWDSIEDLIKARSADAYVAVEKNMIQIEQALMPDKPECRQGDRAGGRGEYPVQRRPGDGGERSARNHQISQHNNNNKYRGRSRSWTRSTKSGRWQRRRTAPPLVLGVLVIGLIGTVTELVLLEHYEQPLQFVPLLLIVIGVVVLAWHAARPDAASCAACRSSWAVRAGGLRRHGGALQRLGGVSASSSICGKWNIG